MKHDLAIIGGGPAGYVAAERAAAKGLKVVLFEKSKLGGVCLNEGCIPTKTMLYSAKVLDTIRSAEKYGIKADEIHFDYKKITDRKNKVVRKLVAGVQAKMRSFEIEVVNAPAEIIERSDDSVKLRCNEQLFEAKSLLICTGSEAFIPNIPGISESAEYVVTNKEILEMKELPGKLVIIGGGVIGMEFASFFHSMGTEVCVLEMMPEILTGMDKTLSEMLRRMYTQKGLRILTQARVTRVEHGTVFYTQEEQEYSVEGDKILLSVGRRPNTSGFGLENLGVELYKGGIRVNEHMQTNVPGVYAAGDVTGFSLLAHTASREAEVAVHTLCGVSDSMHYNAIPAVVYTNPEIAGVGLTEEAAIAQGIACKVAELPMSYSGRFVAENELGNGLCKVLLGSEDGKVLGVHMLGNPASEIIQGACIAIEQGMNLESLKKVVFPHPTVSEIMKETLYEF